MAKPVPVPTRANTKKIQVPAASSLKPVPPTSSSKSIPPASSSKSIPSDAKPKSKASGSTSKKLTSRERAKKERERLKKAKEKAKEKEKEKEKKAKERARLSEQDKAFRRAERLKQNAEKKKKKAEELMANTEKEKEQEVVYSNVTARRPQSVQSSTGATVAPSIFAQRSSSTSSMDSYSTPSWSFPSNPPTSREVYGTMPIVVQESSSTNKHAHEVAQSTRITRSNNQMGQLNTTLNANVETNEGPCGQGPKEKNEDLYKSPADRDGAIKNLVREAKKHLEEYNSTKAALRDDLAAKDAALANKDQELKEVAQKHSNESKACRLQLQMYQDDYKLLSDEQNELKERLERIEAAATATAAAMAALQVERDALQSELKALYETQGITQNRVTDEKEGRAAVSKLLEESTSKINMLNRDLETVTSELAELRAVQLASPPTTNEGDARKQLEVERQHARIERENSKKERESLKQERDGWKKMADAEKMAKANAYREHRARELDLKEQLKQVRAQLDDIKKSNSETSPETNPQGALQQTVSDERYEELYAKWIALTKEKSDNSKRKHSEMEGSTDEGATIQKIELTETKLRNLSTTYITVSNKYSKLKAKATGVCVLFGNMADDQHFGDAGKALKKLKTELDNVDKDATQSPGIFPAPN